MKMLHIEIEKSMVGVDNPFEVVQRVPDLSVDLSAALLKNLAAVHCLAQLGHRIVHIGHLRLALCSIVTSFSYLKFQFPRIFELLVLEFVTLALQFVYLLLVQSLYALQFVDLVHQLTVIGVEC